jgi:phosphoglycerol transferase MdoB-like AlkP superfamily enzyme
LNLLADHYPYGLSLEEINELSSYKRDELFEINHNALIIYNSSMKNINITKVGMPIDVLPTIYNLFDIKYDLIKDADNGIYFMNKDDYIFL